MTALLTRWGRDLDPENVLPEYPRPQLTRPDWAKDAFAYLDQPAARKYPAKPTRLRRRRRA